MSSNTLPDATAGMLVSVIIPTFDREALLPRAVRSVLAQTHATLECIVVDDGSTDRSLEILAPMADADDRLRVFRQANAGVAAARNTGIALGRGEYVALLDSDDEWLPRKLEVQLAWMRREGWEVSQTGEIWMRKGRRVNPMRKHTKPTGECFGRALEMCLVSPSCAMFTRGFVGDVGVFDPELRACEDYDYWLRALLRHEIGLVPEALTIRHGGRGDQLSSRMLGQDFFRIRSLCKLLRNRDLDEGRREMVVRVLQEKQRIYVQGCQKRGRLEEARYVLDHVREAMER